MRRREANHGVWMPRKRVPFCAGYVGKVPAGGWLGFGGRATTPAGVEMDEKAKRRLDALQAHIDAVSPKEGRRAVALICAGATSLVIMITVAIISIV
jgi:hypothetical protein